MISSRSARNTASSMSVVTKKLVRPVLLEQARVVLPHQLLGHRVQAAERLVEDHDARVVDHRARELGAALHAARELRRDTCCGTPGGPTLLSRNSARSSVSRVTSPRARGPVQDVVVGGHPREERGLLEHDQAVAVRAGHRLAVEPDRALGRPLEPGEQADQRALAAARRADHDRQLAALDGERAVAHDVLVPSPPRRSSCDTPVTTISPAAIRRPAASAVAAWFIASPHASATASRTCRASAGARSRSSRRCRCEIMPTTICSYEPPT